MRNGISEDRTKDGRGIAKYERLVMLQLADILSEEALITPEEKFRLKQFIQRGVSQ